jgi:hypothetical protein
MLSTPGSFPPPAFGTYNDTEYAAIRPLMIKTVDNEIYVTAYTLRHSYVVICHKISEQVGVAITDPLFDLFTNGLFNRAFRISDTQHRKA